MKWLKLALMWIGVLGVLLSIYFHAPLIAALWLIVFMLATAANV